MTTLILLLLTLVNAPDGLHVSIDGMRVRAASVTYTLSQAGPEPLTLYIQLDQMFANGFEED